MQLKSEHELVIERWSQLKTERSKYIPKWKDIQNYSAITNNIEYEFEGEQKENVQKDIFINDPTGFTATNNAGDYMTGILFEDNNVTLEPSDFIKKNSPEDHQEFYKKATETMHEQMRANESGLLSIARSYSYDQQSYGNSGIGTFKNKEFENGQSEYCLTYKPYGVWNSCISTNGIRVNVVYSVYNWRLSEIIQEFCLTDDVLDEAKIKQLPEQIQKAFESNDFNKPFKLIYAILPNNQFRMNKRGKKGARFKGYWFLESTKIVFREDYYKEMPVAFCRYIFVNNQVYGEGPGGLSISATKLLNYVAGKAVDNIDKKNDPALGIISGALVNGNVLDRSSGSVTAFNPQAFDGKSSPIFPLADIGDVSSLVQYLIPKTEKDIINTYKIDQLLDFNNDGNMTATESTYRMGIRGKSISGPISQQKAELLEPLYHRSISVIQDSGLFGHILDEMPERTEEEILLKQKVIEENEYIPDVIAQAMKDGKKWYKLRFSGEIEKLANAEKSQNFSIFMQGIQLLISIKPQLAFAIDWYKLLDFLKSLSNFKNENLVCTEREFNTILSALQEAEAKTTETQDALAESEFSKNMAAAEKDGAIADAAYQ